MSIPVLTNLDLNRNQLLNAGLQQLAADPGSPFEGQIWLNTAEDEFKVFIDGAVRIIQTGPITDADVAAANKDGAAGTPSMRTLGGGAQQAMAGNTRLDQVAAPTAAVGFNGQRITGLANGIAGTDGATVDQVNAAAAGLDVKGSVRAATTADVALTGTPTIDDVALVAGDRVLVKNQTAPEENGIYVVAAGAWARADDFDAWAEVPGALVAVEEGTANADAVYVSTADQGGTLDTTAITFSRLNVPSTGTQKFADDIDGDAAATQFTVTHNLGTTDVSVAVYDVTADLLVLADVKRPTANTVRIDFAQAPANGKTYRVVVIG